MKRVAIFAVLGALAGCATALPVIGQSSDGSEVFRGSSTGTIEGGGTLTIASNLGRTCQGEFYYINDRAGAGTLRCTDGSIGSFSFVGAGSRGTGTAVIGNQNYTFSFG